MMKILNDACNFFKYSFFKHFFRKLFLSVLIVMQLLLSISFSLFTSLIEASSVCHSTIIGASSFTEAMSFSMITKNRKADNTHKPAGVDAWLSLTVNKIRKIDKLNKHKKNKAFGINQVLWFIPCNNHLFNFSRVPNRQYYLQANC